MQTVTASQHLTLISQLYELEDDKRRAIAFRDAARAVTGHDALTESDALKLMGVGKSSAKVIAEFGRTGTSARLRELSKRWPVKQIAELTKVKGIGPKKAMTFIDDGLTTIPRLVKAVNRGKIKGNLASEILRAGELKQGRIDREVALPVALRVVDALKSVKGVTGVEVCGSFRRKRATVKDLDVVACAPERVHAALHAKLRELGTTRNKGAVRGAVLIDGISVDLWTVKPESWGAALNHATGSRPHNVWRRTALSKIGVKENEYGLWRGSKRVGGAREEDAYELLGVPFVKPEDREEAPR